MTMNNNEVIKKLRIALDLKEADMIEIFEFAEYEMKKTELTGLFRKEGHKHYKECNDELLRLFLDGFITYKRGAKKEQ